jgi:hypothetical protein
MSDTSDTTAIRNWLALDREFCEQTLKLRCLLDNGQRSRQLIVEAGLYFSEFARVMDVTQLGDKFGSIFKIDDLTNHMRLVTREELVLSDIEWRLAQLEKTLNNQTKEAA